MASEQQPQLSEEEIKKRIALMKENCIFCKIVIKSNRRENNI